MPLLGKTKQVALSEFRCAEILEAARKVFALKGFNAATMDEIAETAGVAKGTVYLYFKSKREIYLAAVRQGFASVTEQTRSNMEAAGTPAEKLRAFIATHLQYAEDNREFVKIYHSEFNNVVHPACIDEDFRARYVRHTSTLTKVLDEAAALGEVRAMRTETAAYTIFEMIRGLVVQRLLGWSTASVEEDVEFLFQLIWKGVAPAHA